MQNAPKKCKNEVFLLAKKPFWKEKKPLKIVSKVLIFNGFICFVGVKGFEPSTPCSQSRCANRTALHPVQMAFCSFASAKIRFFIGYMRGGRAIFGNKSTNNLEAGEFYQEFLVARCLKMDVYLGAVAHPVNAHHCAAPETLVHNDAAGFHAAGSLCYRG